MKKLLAHANIIAQNVRNNKCFRKYIENFPDDLSGRASFRETLKDAQRSAREPDVKFNKITVYFFHIMIYNTEQVNIPQDAERKETEVPSGERECCHRLKAACLIL